MTGLGHNKGPSLEAGAGFRKVAWTKARAALLPTLPLEVVRLRVKRAQRLGLPYKTYATVRAVTGRDIVGFLFSSNALDMRRGHDVPAVERARLIALDGLATRWAAVHAPIDPGAVPEAGVIDGAGRAPGLATPWRATRDTLRAMAQEAQVPFDGLVVVSATALEAEWSGTAGLGGTIHRDVMFSGRGTTLPFQCPRVGLSAR
ncbi:hypothetical protein [Jannaschia sp. CCS1]|uniref:hypothetical protein n=1 Tax=Jannaschia sp. (strain CCS1) TaxID=290400 RepID=UPI000053D88E|nr:hypothetical protein [Jannaschia sp. CCS1]ABD56332.1 hypothetical protein Jann_3415 [Jannaschia sp. CCS1]